MADRIIKHNIFIYDKEGIPVDVTPYVEFWNIKNGGVKSGNTGLDGVVQTGSMIIRNDLEANFNPESEYGLIVSESVAYVGDGGNIYALPENVKQSYSGVDFSSLYGIGFGEIEDTSLYGNINVSGDNFIVPFSIPFGTEFNIILTYIDYS